MPKEKPASKPADDSKDSLSSKLPVLQCYLIENFVGDSAAVETPDALLVQVLQKRRVWERLAVADLLESQSGEGHVDLDAVEVHLDDRNEGFVNGAKFGHFGLFSQPFDERTGKEKALL